MTPIEAVLSKLNGVTRQGKDGYTAKCPAHEDKKNSLGITEAADGKVLVKCYAGTCSTDAICKAIGLEMKDLFPTKAVADRKQGKKREFRKIVAEYWYTDENGVNAHQTVRFEPKGFSQRHWLADGKGRWNWTLLGIKTYLFDLPALLVAKAEGREIWLPEGEKDVRRIQKGGEASTTNPMGACNWKPEYTEWLRGCKVTLVRDPDKAGYKRTTFLYKELTAAGCFVRAVQAADISKNEDGTWLIKDAFDHLEAGRGFDEFEPVDPLEKWKEPAKAPELAIVEGVVSPDLVASVPPPEKILIGSGRDPGDRYYPATEHGNCRRIVDRFGEDIRWVPEFGNFIWWDSMRWVVDWTEGAPLQAMAVQVIRDLERSLDQFERGSGAYKERLKFIAASASKRGIKAMIDLAKCETGMAIKAEDLDSDDFLAGAPNGTIDLRTGELMAPRREDYITKQLGVAYDPDAKCEGFRTFLNDAVKCDKDLYSYMWRAMGYSLTGSTKAECFFFAHGPGGGGKGTMFRVLKVVMGDYAKTLRSASLQAKNMDAIPQDIAKLKGARIAFVHETAENKRWDENLIKELTGGNEVTARFMRENEFEFLPKFKLWIAGNHKPDIISFDRSWARRLRLLPFTNIIAEEDADDDLKLRLAAEQAPGVLAQMVRYCVKWQQEGMKEASVMKAALAKYREESDAIMRYLEEFCELDVYDDENGTKADTLYKGFRAWAKEFGEFCGSAVWFGKDLILKGFERKRLTKGWHYIGITLKDPQSTIEAEDPRASGHGGRE